MNNAQNLDIHIPIMQQQIGSSDCGVFTITFAFHAAMGVKVKDLEFARRQ